MLTSPSIQWFTPIEIAPLPTAIAGRYGGRILTLGSCFSEHIGERMRHLGYDVLVNPYGTLYNPISICDTLEDLLCDEEHRPDYTPYIVERDGLYYSLRHHSAIYGVSLEEAQEATAQLWYTAHRRLAEADWLWITLGTTQVYYLAEGDRAVANCQQLSARLFDRRDLPLGLLQERMLDTLSQLLAKHPLQVILTVSPVRYLQDGLAESNLSKSKLRILCDTLCRELPACHYFPAYEILHDELRDYRFYASDLTHPSEEAIDYIADHFVSYWASQESREVEMRQAAQRLRKLAQHRPKTPHGAERLQAQIAERIAHYQEQYGEKLCIPSIVESL